jgi:hypothetical protein
MTMRGKELREHLEQQFLHLACAAHEASQSDTARHLRNSGCELLRAVRSSLDGVIEFLEPTAAEKPCAQPQEPCDGAD